MADITREETFTRDDLTYTIVARGWLVTAYARDRAGNIETLDRLDATSAEEAELAFKRFTYFYR